LIQAYAPFPLLTIRRCHNFQDYNGQDGGKHSEFGDTLIDFTGKGSSHFCGAIHVQIAPTHVTSFAKCDIAKTGVQTAIEYVSHVFDIMINDVSCLHCLLLLL